MRKERDSARRLFPDWSIAASDREHAHISCQAKEVKRTWDADGHVKKRQSRSRIPKADTSMHGPTIPIDLWRLQTTEVDVANNRDNVLTIYHKGTVYRYRSDGGIHSCIERAASLMP